MVWEQKKKLHVSCYLVYMVKKGFKLESKLLPMKLWSPVRRKPIVCPELCHDAFELKTNLQD